MGSFAQLTMQMRSTHSLNVPLFPLQSLRHVCLSLYFETRAVLKKSTFSSNFEQVESAHTINIHKNWQTDKQTGIQRQMTRCYSSSS